MNKYKNINNFNKKLLDDYLVKKVPQYIAKFWIEPNKWYISGDILLSFILNKEKYHTNYLKEINDTNKSNSLDDIFYDGEKMFISSSLESLIKNNELKENYDWNRLKYYFGDKKLVPKDFNNIILLDLPQFEKLSSIEKLSLLNKFDLTINQFEQYFQLKFSASRELITKILIYDNLLVEKDFSKLTDTKLVLAIHSFNPIAKEYFDLNKNKLVSLEPELANLIEVSNNYTHYSKDISINYHQKRLQEMVFKKKKLNFLKNKRTINSDPIFFSEDYTINLDEKINLTEIVIRNEIVSLKNLGVKDKKYDNLEFKPQYNLAHFLYYNKFNEINKNLLGLKGKNNLTLVHFTLLWKKVDFWKILLEGLDLDTIINYLSLESCFGNGWTLMSKKLNMGEMFLRLIVKKELSDEQKIKIGNNLLLYCDVGFFDFVKDCVTFNEDIFKKNLPFRSAIYLIKNGIDPNDFLENPKKWNEEEVSIIIDKSNKELNEILPLLIKWDISIFLLNQFDRDNLSFFQKKHIKEVINESNFLLIIDQYGFEILEDFGITWYGEIYANWIKKNNIPFVNKFGQRIDHFSEHNIDNDPKLDYFGLSPKKYHQLSKVIKILKILNS